MQRAVSAGESDYDAGISALEIIYGYKNDEAKRILGDKEKLEKLIKEKQQQEVK